MDPEKLVSMVEMIVKAMEEGREDDLRKAGFGVTRTATTPLEEITEKLKDPELARRIIGDIGEEEEEVMSAMRRAQEEFAAAANGLTSGYTTDIDIDDDLFEELRLEAAETIASMQRGDTKSMAALIGDPQVGTISESILAPPKQKSSIANSKSKDTNNNASVRVSQDVAADIVTDSMLRPLSGSWSANSPTKDEGGGGMREEVEYEDEDDDNNNEGNKDFDKQTSNNVDNTDKGANKNEQVAGGFSSIDKVVAAAATATSTVMSVENTPAPPPTSASTCTETNQALFAEILKATMQAQEEAGTSTEEDQVKSTLEVVKTGDMDNLDLKSILGDALLSLTDQLGIDVKAELSDAQTKGQMQTILASSMAELAQNMKELDERSTQEFEKLSRLQEELARETQALEERKQDELAKILAEQTVFQRELKSSALNVQASQEQLEKLMSDLENNADVMTALALFPVKPISKKVAFVVGLSLVLKVPFDAMQLIAIQTADFSDIFGLAVQAALCVALFHYYGLVQAFMRGNSDFKGPTIPPPPPPPSTPL